MDSGDNCMQRCIVDQPDAVSGPGTADLPTTTIRATLTRLRSVPGALVAQDIFGVGGT